jgi:hypothetical protein
MNTSTQEINMDNLTIVIAGLIGFLTILVLAELLAKHFNWE